MFTLEELKMIKELCDANGVAIPFRSAALGGRMYEKLISTIAEMERKQAATPK